MNNTDSTNHSGVNPANLEEQAVPASYMKPAVLSY
jgi:hypothetical protein